MLRLITGVFVLALTVPALAEQPSYNFVAGSWQTLELDGGGVDVDGDGFSINGSFDVLNNWHIAGEYSSNGFDFGVDLNRLALGGGYHSGISETTSFYADVSWVNWEVDTGSTFGSIDDDGYGVEIGLRSNITDRLELAGGIGYIDFGDGGDDTLLNGGAWYRFDTFSLGLNVEIGDDITGFGIGGRFYFDN